MQLNPYLTFNGNCEAAFKFYAEVLGGKIVAMMPHEGTPAAEHVPSEWRSKIVRMPIQPTFWAERFGMLVDQFGTPWMINCERANP
jgi:PhnB protein